MNDQHHHGLLKVEFKDNSMIISIKVFINTDDRITYHLYSLYHNI